MAIKKLVKKIKIKKPIKFPLPKDREVVDGPWGCVAPNAHDSSGFSPICDNEIFKIFYKKTDAENYQILLLKQFNAKIVVKKIKIAL